MSTIKRRSFVKSILAALTLPWIPYTLHAQPEFDESDFGLEPITEADINEITSPLVPHTGECKPFTVHAQDCVQCDAELRYNASDEKKSGFGLLFMYVGSIQCDCMVMKKEFRWRELIESCEILRGIDLHISGIPKSPMWFVLCTTLSPVSQLLEIDRRTGRVRAAPSLFVFPEQAARAEAIFGHLHGLPR